MSDSMESTLPLLESAPEEGARRLALRRIDEATAAAELVIEGGDEESLHELRVSLRKLRTVLRTYDDELGSALSKKRRKRLKDLVGATGPARDAEVQLAWLEEAKGDLLAEARPGIDWLVQRLTARRDEAYEQLRTETAPALLALLPKLRRKLARYEIEHVVFEARPSRRFAEATAALVRAQSEELRRNLRSVRSIEDEARAHEARKDGKRLRYLLEPLRDEQVEGAKESVKALKRLQDLLGELNDVAIRAQLLREEVEHAALERARQLAERAEGHVTSKKKKGQGDEQPGLLALVSRTHERRLELFTELTTRWIPKGSALDELIDGVEGFADQLAAGAASEGSTGGDAPDDALPREIERKYLLSSLPDHVREHAAIAIDQGYVPGREIHERLRRTEKDGEEHWYRTIKLGRGVSRIEIEEETTRAIFTKMWPLTKGHRVRKRRWKITEGDLVWEIDEFLDRELALAEIELPSEDTEVVIPAWLEGCLVREVTDDPSYLNLNLAR